MLQKHIDMYQEHIMQQIAGITRIQKRVDYLRSKGYSVNEYPMGSGGVGQVKVMSDHIRIQIGYGHGKHNYAYAVVIPN